MEVANNTISQFMGNNINFQLIKNASEEMKRINDIRKELSKFDYSSDVLNELPDAIRRNYIIEFYGLLKLCRNVINNVKNDDVVIVNPTVINEVNSYDINNII
jgi:hypothetical protein